MCFLPYESRTYDMRISNVILMRVNISVAIGICNICISYILSENRYCKLCWCMFVQSNRFIFCQVCVLGPNLVSLFL